MAEMREVEDVVLVAGHPRSGTSLACQVTETAGVNFEKEMGEDAYNKGGYYEMEGVKEFSSKITREGMNKENTKKLNQVAKRLEKIESPRGIKLVHLPAVYYFNQIFKNPRMVLIYRDPREVKSSLFRRGFSSFPIPWGKNNNALLSLHQNYENSILISYKSLLKKKKSVKSKFSELDLDIDFSPVKSGWKTQETPEMGLSPKEKEVYSILRELESRGEEAEDPDSLEL
mgnify:CR=1 FL=1